MAEPPAPWRDYIDAVAPANSLDIPEAWKPTVALFLGMAADAAALYIDLPLDERADEAAPVFRPGHRP